MARVLYSGPLSLFARKAEIALREKGLAFEQVMVPFTQAKGYQPKHPVVLAANPKAQVPVLVDGELTLFDSTVIFEYLEDLQPIPPLYPKAPAARALCRLLELRADEVLLPSLRALMHRSEPPSDPARCAQQEVEATQAEAALRGHYDDLAARLGAQDYFCGDFTVADVALFMSLFWAQRLKGPRLDGHPRLAAWYARVQSRPAVAQVVAELQEADRALSPDLYL